MRPLLAAALATFVLPALSPAHFIWADYDRQTRSAKVEFGEAPGEDTLPIDAKLAGKFDPKPPTFANPALLYPMEQTPVFNCSVLYGVVHRGEEPFLLTYQAKTMPLAALAGKVNGKGLEIIGQPHKTGWRLQVLWNGTPTTKAELFDKEGGTVKLDDAGYGYIEVSDEQRIPFRASFREEGKGNFEQKAYNYKKTWATVVLPAIGKVGENSDWESYRALQLASEARESLTSGVVFSCRFTASDGSQNVTGAVSQDSKGQVTIHFDREDPNQEHVKGQLSSLFMHRRSVPFWQGDGKNVIQATSDVNDLGSKILVDDRFKSSYRVKDGIVRVVDRSFGPSRLVLTVDEVKKLPSGRYLSKKFRSVSTDAEGKVTSELSYQDEFVLVGGEHMPKLRTVKGRTNGKDVKMSVAFSDYKFN